MSIFRRKRDWELTEREVTPEALYMNRRRFLASLGLGLGGATALAYGMHNYVYAQEGGVPGAALLGVPRNKTYADGGRPVSEEALTYRYNNFYEFSTDKYSVATQARDFSLDPYTLHIDGLVDKPLRIGLEDIEKMALEERIYRFRCVEAWSMCVPWIGIPLRVFLEMAGVSSAARYVRFVSFYDPDQAPGQRDTSYQWPYYEALGIDEAMHDLCFVAIGMYGKKLAPQNGAPLRIIVPWKYGYKGAKSVVRIELLAQRPGTFWNDLHAEEYGFVSNVDPAQAHPRWSQAEERLIGSSKRIPTELYNGYGNQVAGLYGVPGV